jgi:hypothetical protein
MSLFGLDLHGKLDRIYELLEKIMTAQDDINAAVAQLAQTQANEANAVTVLGVDVTALTAALAAGGGTPVDTSALNAAVAAQSASDTALATAVGDVTALVPPATAGGSPA